MPSIKQGSVSSRSGKPSARSPARRPKEKRHEQQHLGATEPAETMDSAAPSTRKSKPLQNKCKGGGKDNSSSSNNMDRAPFALSSNLTSKSSDTSKEIFAAPSKQGGAKSRTFAPGRLAASPTTDQSAASFDDTNATTSVFRIESPPPDMLRMEPQVICRGILDEVVKPYAERVFEMFLGEGFVLNPSVNHRVFVEGAFGNADPSKSRAVGYAVVSQKDGRITKNGISTNATQREQLSKAKGIITEDESLVEIFNLDLLTSDMDNYLQEQYREMIAALMQHCPEPFCNLLSVYVERGGERLGTKKGMIHQMLEIGSQIHFRTRITAEFLMFDQIKYADRQAAVQNASNQLCSALDRFFGAEKRGRVPVDVVSSWMPGVTKELKNGRPRLLSTPVVLESILGRPVNMDDIDTVPYGPPGPDPYDSSAYTADNLAFGLDRFNRFVDELPPYRILVLDRNSFLFAHDPRAALNRLQSKGFRICVIMWDHEVVLLLNDEEMNGIYLHGPFGEAGDARDELPIERIVKRNMTAQVTTQVVAWCQGKDGTRGQMNSSFHDANFAGYTYEHFVNAMHFGRRHGAAMARDVLTPPPVFALKQNDLGKTHLDDPSYPIAKNLRKSICQQYRDEEGDEEKDYDDISEDDDEEEWGLDSDDETDRATRINNFLVIRRVMNLVSFVETEGQLAPFVAKADEILAEDNPSPGTLSKRWSDSILNRLNRTSWLRKAIQRELDSRKSNSGNKTSTGKTKAEKVSYNEQLATMKALGKAVKFWVFLENKFKKQGLAPPDKDEVRGYPVFDQLVFEGVRTHFKKDPDFSIQKITASGIQNTAALKSRNGAFVLCELKDKN